MILVSIDPSITSTSVCYYDAEENKTNIRVYTEKLLVRERGLGPIYLAGLNLYVNERPKDFIDAYERYNATTNAIVNDIVQNTTPNNSILVIEGGALLGHNLYSIGQFVGMLIGKLYDAGYTIQETYPSSSWKKDLGLKGNGKKPKLREYAMTTPLRKLLVELERLGITDKKGSFVEDIIDSFLIGQAYLKRF